MDANTHFLTRILILGLPYTLATSCEELTDWKRLWCWEGLGAGGEGDDRGWDGWMASLTRWMWVWVNSESLWWTGRPGVLWFMGSQRVGHDWATELNWTIKIYLCTFPLLFKIYLMSDQVTCSWSSSRTYGFLWNVLTGLGTLLQYVLASLTIFKE